MKAKKAKKKPLYPECKGGACPECPGGKDCGCKCHEPRECPRCGGTGKISD